MNHSVTGGKHPRVKFVCPSCTTPLESPIEDAGQQFGCPTCANVLIVPGADDLVKHVQETANREAARKAQRLAAETLALEETRARQARDEQSERERQRTIAYESARVHDERFGDVPRSASRLRAAANVLAIFGWFYIASGVLVGVVAVCVALASADPRAWAILGVVTPFYVLGAVVLGVLLLGVGSALRMLASIGLAAVEVARKMNG